MLPLGASYTTNVLVDGNALLLSLPQHFISSTPYPSIILHPNLTLAIAREMCSHALQSPSVLCSLLAMMHGA